ncbi:MAG: hypothetical protein RSD57_12900 [Comamonas sp.]
MTALHRLLATAFMAFGLMQTASAQVVIPADADMDLAGADLDLGCESIEIGGTYSLSGGSLIGTGALLIQPGGSLNAQGQLGVGGDFDNQGNLNTSNGSVTLNGACIAPGGTIKISGTASFTNLTLISTSGQTFEFLAGANITVTGSLTVQGDPSKPVILAGASGQPVGIQLAPGAQVSQTNVLLNNVTIGESVKPPVTVTPTPVPVLSDVLVWILSLLVFALSFGALRSSRSPFVSRT